MNKKVPYDRNSPYNQLPLLPPLDEKVIDIDILTKLAKTRGVLGKLDGIVRTLPNPYMLVNTITLSEAKDSSEIESIFTTHDELYQAIAVDTTEMSASAREVLRYREALEVGISLLKEYKNSKCFFVEKSLNAIRMTKKNAKNFNFSARQQRLQVT
jgi:Fic family protein